MLSSVSQPVLLASASARRRKILEELGLVFESAAPEVEEVHHEEDPRRSATENALCKLQWARERYPGRRIIAADTVIDFRGRCVGKPSSLQESAAMLLAFSGREHSVLTGVGVTLPKGGERVTVVESRVQFRHLNEPLVARYFSQVNPLDKAGAYDIDQHGDLLIASYSGSYTNIMGLSRELICAWLEEWKI